MSADTVIKPLQATSVRHLDPQDLLGGSVDLFDAVAHLEANGMGDSAARRAGYVDVLDHARQILGDAQHPAGGRSNGQSDSRAARTRAGLRDSAARVVTLIAGVLVCIASMPAGTSTWIMCWAGAVGWLSGQAVSAAMWQGLGTGSRSAAAAGGITTSLAGLAASGLVAVALGEPTALVWAVWSMAVSALIVLTDLRVLAGYAVAAATLSTLALHLANPSVAIVVALAATLGAGGRAAYVLRSEAAGTSLRLVGAGRRAVTLSTIQTCGQLSILWMLMDVVGDAGFSAIALAGLVAGAGADLILEAASVALRRVVAMPVGWDTGRRASAGIGVAAVLSVVLLSLVTAGIALARLGAGAVPATGLVATVAGTVLVASLTAAAGLQLRVGAAAGAAGLSVLAAGTTAVAAAFGVLAPIVGVPALVAAATVVGLAALTVGGREMSRPTLW